MPAPVRTIVRLSLYRRLLQAEQDRGIMNIYSHQIAGLAGVTAAQIRRDLTYVGYTGCPKMGYSVPDLKKAVEEFLTPDGNEKLALAGVGNLGRAIIDYFSGRHRRLSIEAAFDNDREKYGRVICGCRCYPMNEIKDVVKRERISTAIIAVPPDQAQKVTDELVLSGITGIMNFAPVNLRVPRNVYVENNDLTMAIEKVAFFGRKKAVSESFETGER